MQLKGECSDPVLDVPVSEIIVHENYNSEEKTNDIALLRLSQDINFSKWIQPISLPSAEHLRNKVYDNFPLLVVNFGQTENGMAHTHNNTRITVKLNVYLFAASYSPVKLKLEVNGANSDHCKNDYKQFNTNIQNTHLCAGSKDDEFRCGGKSGNKQTI